MKFAASDYDGTLFRNERIEQSDAEAIARWRAAGHKFGVVSGRDLGMLIPMLAHYGVRYDYLAANNGGIICGVDNRPLWEAELPPALLARVAALPKVAKSFHYAFSAADRTYLCHAGEGSWVMREATEWGFTIVTIEESAIADLPRVHQFALGFTDPADAAAASAEVNARYGDTVHAYPNRCAVDIIPKSISKEQAIAHTLELFGWQGAEILAIGDEANDLPMIEAYGGYAVDTARDAIKAHARATCASVGAMLDANR